MAPFPFAFAFFFPFFFFPSPFFFFPASLTTWAIAVRFAYEWHDDSGSWFRSYGNENWEFNEHGFMQRRIASINDLPIAESDRIAKPTVTPGPRVKEP